MDTEDAVLSPTLRTTNERNRPCSWRAFLVGAVCVAVSVCFVTQAEVVLSSVRIGYLQLPPVAIAMLLFVLAFRKLLPFLKLSSSDVLLVYCMTLVGVMVSSHGVVEKLVPGLVSLNYFGSANNDWHGLFDSHVAARLVPYNPADGHLQAVSQYYYEGLPRGQSVPWGRWLPPILNWAVLVFLVIFAFLCLTAILRRQWVEHEHLSFPLTQVPLAIMGEGGRPLFCSPLAWLGVMLPVVVFGAKMLHQVWPTIPDIPVFYVLNDYLPTPWSSVSYTPLCLSFAAVGMMYLLPVDILFSIWFFFLLTRVQQFGAISFNVATPGMPTMPTLLFTGFQTLGAYLVIAGSLIWAARPHLRRVWAAATGREKGDDSEELLPYRVAVFGLFGSLIAASTWLWLMGMSWWLAAGELTVYVFVIALVMARSTAEAGMLMTETTFRPVDIVRVFAPLHSLGPANLTMLAFCDNLFTRDLRGLVLTGFLDSAKIGDSTQVSRRTLGRFLCAGVLLAFVIAVALNVSIPYHKSANAMDPYLEKFSPTFFWADYSQYLSSAAVPSTDTSWQIPGGVALGIAVALFLTFMRAAFFWWPLHPLGYALAGVVDDRPLLVPLPDRLAPQVPDAPLRRHVVLHPCPAVFPRDDRGGVLLRGLQCPPEHTVPRHAAGIPVDVRTQKDWIRKTIND